MISTNKFTRVNQINQNKFGSYYHSNSSKFLNKIFQTETEEEVKLIPEPPKEDVIIPPPSIQIIENENLIILNKIETEPIIIPDEPLEVIQNIEEQVINNTVEEPVINNTIEEPIIIIPDDQENHIELSDLYDETPEETLIVSYINENFRENSIKKVEFLTTQFIRSKSWR